MSALTFSFENSPVNVIFKDGEAWFIASQVTKAIHLTNPSVALKSLRSVEKSKMTIDGRETNIISESGLYTLILRCQDAIKEGTPAFQFRVMVTDVILPSIRKTGKYECPLSPETLTEAHSYAIMSAVAKRAKSCGAHYQTIYRALKARYQVTKYTHIRESDFEDAMRFIQTVDLRVPEAATEESPFDENGRCKLCGLRPVPSGSLVLDARDADRLLTWVYYWRYLFRTPLHLFAEFLGRVGSPYAGAFHEAVADPYMGFLEDILRKNGYDVRQLKCYQYFIAHNA